MKLVFNADILAKSIDTNGENEIVFEEYFDIQKSEDGNPKDPEFEYFKKKILDHLAELEKKENKSITKSINVAEWIQKANFPVGTVRTWNGQKFKKITPKKWARVYELQSRGAKLAVAALRRKAAACKNSEELLQLVLANKERFVDENGKPLGFMQEFSEYVSGLNDKHEQKKDVLSILEDSKNGYIKDKNGIYYNKEKGIGFFPSKWGKNRYEVYVNGKYHNMNVSGANGFENMEKEALFAKENEETKATGDNQKTDDKHDGGAKTVAEAKSKDDSSADMETDFGIIRRKYQSSKSIEGDEDEIYVGKETIVGKWKLVEADAPSASHDELTFHKTKGFPTGINGSTVNDRDYEHDTAAQETVLDIAADFDGRALGFDSPIVVTQDGVVTSGNNRTMSSKLAARKGTDIKYIEALKKRAKKFGFSADDVAQFKHPRVVFETEHKGEYTTDEFAKYNESGKKAKSPIEKAVEVSKRMKPQIVEEIAGTIGDFETMGNLYADKKASMDIFNTLIQSNIIQKTDLPQYCTDGVVTAAGKEFLETVLIGSVIDEGNIRQLNTEGGKSIRQKLVRAITPLIENRGMKGYSINKELNEAVSISVEVAHNKDKFPNVESFSQQQDMFRKLDPVSIELAKKLEGTQKGFAEFMQTMNGGLRPAANGEVDIFFGGIESKEEIVNRVLHIKETVKKALDRFFGIFGATV